MAILFDAAMLAVVLITVILCIKRGFVESLFRSLGFITAVFCALILTSVISPFLKDAFVEDLSFKFVSTTVCKQG
ncbi:MAG: CvpA family protein, partial [Clostridia bacterium]|nr:CvpA family protein [Clostridia bacterium]